MLHAIACIQSQPLLVSGILTFLAAGWLLDSKSFKLDLLHAGHDCHPWHESQVL